MLAAVLNPVGLLSLLLLTASSVTALSPRAARGLGARRVSSKQTGDLQTSLILDSSQIQSNLADNGQNPPVAGQVASLTSTNNFINFCATTNLPLTNGEQVKSGSCNPTPMGSIIAQAKAPSCKFSFPRNNQVLSSGATFTMTMNIKNLQTGNFVNAQRSYFSAPAQLNLQGILIGHSHVVIEAIDSLDTTTPGDTTKFAFFKGLNDAAVNGVLSATVTGGLPVGFYKMSSINSAANHQPALVGVAQHGTVDDIVYFSVIDRSEGATNAGGTGVADVPAATTTTTAVAAVASTAAATSVATVVTSAASTAITTTAAATSKNLQVFTGALGGIAAAPVTKSGNSFVTGKTKNRTVALSLARSCFNQKIACNVAARVKGAAFTTKHCATQQNQCRAANKI